MAKNLNFNINELADLLEKEERNKYLEQNKSKPKLNLEDFIIKKAKDINRYDVIDPDTSKAIAHFPYYQSKIKDLDLLGSTPIQLPEYITTDYPFVEPEYQGRGLGKQMYKFLERETGKKIMPDTSLSESSKALHSISGLGKEFGSSNYKPDIIEAINKSIGPDKNDIAEEIYKKLKSKISSQGLSNFKSIAPILGKAGIAAAGGVASLAAEAADANEEGGTLEQQALLRENDAQKKVKQIEKSENIPNEVKLKALELFKKNKLPY